MSRRKEKIRKGLEIDLDLLDSDLVRCYLPLGVTWGDGPRPLLVWMEYADREDWTEGTDLDNELMMRTLDDERELAEGRRLLRLLRYKSYTCLAELARRKPEKGEFIIRKPPAFGNTWYVCELDEAEMPAGFGDPDSADFEEEDPGFTIIEDVAEAKRFTHADAIRLTVRIMQVMGYDVPGDNGDYYEPVRLDVAEELHRRAERRPRRSDEFHAMLHDLSREP
jgi:hypothetical protein